MPEQEQKVSHGRVVVVNFTSIDGVIQSPVSPDLIDEYRLLVFPIVIGPGKRMFGDDGHLAHFTHAGTTTSPSGVVILTYTRSTKTKP